MLKKGTFINKRFNRLLLGCVWGSLAYAINLMTDSIVSGNVLGEIALQAVSIVYPLFSVVYIFAYLIAPGAGVLFGKLIGEFKKDEASRVAGTTLVTTIIISIFISLGLWIIKIPFLTYFGCTGTLMQEASKYYNWLILFAIIQVIQAPFYYLTVTDGEAMLVSIANVADISSNVVLSIILSLHYGIAGLGMATCIGKALNIVSYLLHFFRKSNNVKFHLCLDFKYVKRSIVLSFSSYMYYIFLAIVDIILNKIIIMICGLELISAYSVVNLVFGVCTLYEALSTSSMGLITCFLGEKNNHDMQLIFHKIRNTMLLFATVLFALFFFGAPLIPKLYGLETIATINAAIMASRIMAFTTFGFGATYILISIFVFIEKPFWSCFLSFLNDAAMPLLCSIALGMMWGFTGIAIGMSLSPYIAFAIYSLVMIVFKGKKGYPVYFETEDEEGVSYDFYVAKELIPDVRDWVYKQLIGHGFNIENIEILIEELYTRVLEKNSGKRVLSECTLLFSKKYVRIIIRDDGKIFNFVNEENKIESLNAYVLNTLLENVADKQYLITTSFNRNGFVFEKASENMQKI